MAKQQEVHTPVEVETHKKTVLYSSFAGLVWKNVKLSRNYVQLSPSFCQYGSDTLPSFSESCFFAGKDFKVMFLNVPLPC